MTAVFVISAFSPGLLACDHDYFLVEEIEATCTEKGFRKYHCNKCGMDTTEDLDELNHAMTLISLREPTTELDGEVVRVCTRCGYSEHEILERLPTNTSSPTQATLPEAESTISATTETTEINFSVTFEEIYRAYKTNELRADESYKNNRYRITASINGMTTGGLFNLTGGATLTMETRVDSTIVFFFAEFEREQEEALKTINVGDTITFEGECLGAGTWVDCVLIVE